jgi:hypothetical protein
MWYNVNVVLKGSAQYRFTKWADTGPERKAVTVPIEVVIAILTYVAGLITNMLRVSGRFKQVIDKIDGLWVHVDKKFEDADKKLGDLRTHVDTKFDQSQREWSENFRHLDRKVDNIARDVASIRERVAVLETTSS